VRGARFDHGQRRGDEEFAFANGLIRDVAYASVPPEDLPSKHAAAADWIEQAAPRPGDQADLLVHHLVRAVELAQALPQGRRAGFDVDAMAVRAMECLAAAGDRAVRFDVARAQRAYLRALELCPPDHPRRASVLARVAQAAWLTGDFDEARGRYEEVVADALAAGDRAAAGEAMLGVSYTLWNQGATAPARKVLTEAITLLEGGEPGQGLALGYATLAADRFLAGDSEAALMWSEKVLALADELDLPEQKERGLEVRGMARCDLGDQAGVEDLRAALGMALELGLGQEAVRAHINLGTFVLPVDGPAPALELYRAGQALAERRGLAALSMWSRGWAVGPLFELGRWDELLDEADAVVAWERERGGLTQFGLAARLTQAEVLVLRGEVQPAAALVEEFLPQAREINDPQALIPALAVAALVAQAQGAADLAVEMIQELARRSRTGGRWVAALFLAPSVRILEWAGRGDLAERLLEDADLTSARGRHSAASAGAAVAEASGRLEEAGGLYAAAAAGWDAFGFVLERALALAGEARCLAAVGRPAEAADRLAAARALLVGMGMPVQPDPDTAGAPRSPAEPPGDAGA
jgi:tetratricopeptide (TPR) repeat protein